MEANEGGVMKLDNEKHLGTSAQLNNSVISSDEHDQTSSKTSLQSQTDRPDPKESVEDYVSCTETSTSDSEDEKHNEPDPATTTQNDKKQRAINFSYYEGIDPEESCAMSEKRKLMNRRR